MVNLFLFLTNIRDLRQNIHMSKQAKAQDIIDSKLLEERKVFLWGMVDDEVGKTCH